MLVRRDSVVITKGKLQNMLEISGGQKKHTKGGFIFMFYFFVHSTVEVNRKTLTFLSTISLCGNRQNFHVIEK